MTSWRKRLGEAGVAETIEAAKRASVIKTSSVQRVIVDTTVMEKAIAHPTDSRLLERCREHLVKAAARHGLKLRQNYNREAPRLGLQIGRYAHAKQYKHMRKALRTLRSRVGQVMRDVERQVAQVTDPDRAALMELSWRKRRRTSFMGYRWLRSNVWPKAPYEFGVRVSITTTHKEGLVVGMHSMPGNPDDGHTLAEALEQAAILCDVTPEVAIVDLGYKGVAVDGVKISPGLAAGYHTRTTRDGQTAQRDRASHRPHEDRRKTRSQLAQRCAGRCDARGVVRRRPQPPIRTFLFCKLGLIYPFIRSIPMSSGTHSAFSGETDCTPINGLVEHYRCGCPGLDSNRAAGLYPDDGEYMRCSACRLFEFSRCRSDLSLSLPLRPGLRSHLF